MEESVLGGGIGSNNTCGYSSVVERLVANQKVVGSTPIARLEDEREVHRATSLWNWCERVGAPSSSPNLNCCVLTATAQNIWYRTLKACGLTVYQVFAGSIPVGTVRFTQKIVGSNHTGGVFDIDIMHQGIMLWRITIAEWSSLVSSLGS